jgi:hypothetical protein
MTWFLWTISTGTGGHYRPELVDDFTGLRITAGYDKYTYQNQQYIGGQPFVHFYLSSFLETD